MAYFNDSNLPAELSTGAISLLPTSGNLAWPIADIDKAFSWCHEQNLAILGGDVLLFVDGKLTFTGTNWYAEQDAPQETWIEFVDRSLERATAYIARLAMRLDLNKPYLVSVDAVNERDYLRLQAKRKVDSG